MRRIISLVPSLTETLCDLGLQAEIVGCTNFCVHPSSIRKSALSVGGTKDADIEKILALQPTHVLVNDEENPRELRSALSECARQQGFQLVETFPISIEESIEMVETLGRVFQCEENSKAWAAQTRKILAECRAQRPQISIPYAYLIWRNPWMVAGNQTYISMMLAEIGWQNVIETSRDPRERYPCIEPQSELLNQAQVFLFSSEPFPFRQRHLEEFCGLSESRAIALKINGEELSWFGTRTQKGLQYLLNFQKMYANKSETFLNISHNN
jgi:iron complex transport system substrate-binding protein